MNQNKIQNADPPIIVKVDIEKAKQIQKTASDIASFRESALSDSTIGSCSSQIGQGKKKRRKNLKAEVINEERSGIAEINWNLNEDKSSFSNYGEIQKPDETEKCSNREFQPSKNATLKQKCCTIM